MKTIKQEVHCNKKIQPSTTLTIDSLFKSFITQKSLKCVIVECHWVFDSLLDKKSYF